MSPFRKYLRWKWLLFFFLIGAFVACTSYLANGFIQIKRNEKIEAWARRYDGYCWSDTKVPAFLGEATIDPKSDLGKWIRKFFKQTTYLHAKSPGTDPAVPLKQFRNLITIELDGRAGLTRIYDSPHVRILRIRRSGMVDSEFARLETLPALRVIAADRCRPGPLAFSKMAHLPDLEEVYLSHCELDDSDLRLIAKIPSLKYLDLESNPGFSLPGVQEFLRSCDHERIRLGTRFKEHEADLQAENPEIELVFSPF